MTRVMPVALLAALICGPAIAQQSGAGSNGGSSTSSGSNGGAGSNGGSRSNAGQQRPQKAPQQGTTTPATHHHHDANGAKGASSSATQPETTPKSDTGALGDHKKPTTPRALQGGTTPQGAGVTANFAKGPTPNAAMIGAPPTSPHWGATANGAGVGAKHAPMGAISVGAPAISPQPGIGIKTRAGATANSIRGLPPSAFAVGGRAMLKPGQDFIGTKVTAPAK